jgi:hypothetical protein
MLGIEVINEVFALFYEGVCSPEAAPVLLPIGSVKVLNHIDAVLAEARVQELEGSGDMTHDVASII